MHSPDDEQKLSELNVQIGVDESEGDEAAKGRLAQVIAPALAFHRANRTIVTRDEFLKEVGPSGRRHTTIEAIELYGDRAFVRCVVAMETSEGKKRFHNLRLFVRHAGEWKLLGWANEAL